jgi:hydrogenase nickel incorporation protein HypA/HybF
VHELTAIARLIREAEDIARQHGGRPAALTLQVGALSGFTPESLRRAFVDVARGTTLDGARLDVRACEDVADEMAQRLVLLSVDVEA